MEQRHGTERVVFKGRSVDKANKGPRMSNRKDFMITAGTNWQYAEEMNA